MNVEQHTDSHSGWLSAFDQAYRHIDEVGEIPCPHCGQFSLTLVFVVDKPDSADATAVFWCNACLRGLMPGRSAVPQRAERTLRGTEQIPNYQLVLDSDPEQ